MSLLQFFAVLRARRLFALVVLLATVSAAVVAVLLVPRVYTATASLLIDISRPDPVTGLSNGGNPSPAIMATQVGVLKSERVALDVVRRLDLASQPLARKAWMAATKGQGDISRWLAQGLQKTTEILPERDSNVVTISAGAPEPDQAARIANAFAQSYLEVSATMRAESAQGVSAFFSRRAQESRAQLEQARARLAEFQQRKGVNVSDGHLDNETARLAELTSRLEQTESAVADSGLVPALADQSPQALSSPVLAALRGDLLRAETQLQELLGRLDENHPQVIQARATIGALRQRVDAETRRIGNSIGSRHAVQSQRASELRAAVEAQRVRVTRLKASQDEGQIFVRDVDNAQHAYDSVVARLGQASIESHEMQGNASVLAPASPPLAPSSPRRSVEVGLAAALGLLLAGVGVVLLEVADPRLRTDDAVADFLGQPLLGVVPRPSTAGAYRTRKLALVREADVPRLPHRAQEA
jgi:chain length determinant protein EpsF